MSGIVGIFHQDHSAVQDRTLTHLTDFLEFRGPDGRHTWLGGAVGFGHTLFKTAEESRNERQPFSFDGEVWIVADARLDARSELTAKLRDRGGNPLSDATDAELILRAYFAWGEECVVHFLGDFAFAIWDGPRQRLFCARDQMGVKPFYYAHVGDVVIFSNTLECVRRHPAVSGRLNDLAIADFLLVQRNQDASTTALADIQRLPPAHTGIWSAGGKQIRRYWKMPVDPPLLLRRSEEYAERFQELLWQVVGDRLRTNAAGVFMSGGMDSTTMAAGACRVLRERYSQGGQLVALSMADPANPLETKYAGLVAKALEIPIHFFNWGDATIDPAWERVPVPAPEPALNPWELAALQKYYRQAAALSRVFLYGEGPDQALHFEWQPYVSHLVAGGHYARLFRELCLTLIHNRRPPLSARTASALRQARAPRAAGSPPVFPDWVNPALESRYSLRHRWETTWDGLRTPVSDHPIRPAAYAHLGSAFWPTLFGRQDAEWTRAHVETRVPFVDLRMLRFLLAVPPLPWCRSKYLLRRAMGGILPRPVLRRAKWALTSATVIERIVRPGLASLTPEPELDAYVDKRRFPSQASNDEWLLGCELRVRSLNNWLKYQREHNTRQSFGPNNN